MWFFSLTFFTLHLLPITLLPHPVCRHTLCTNTWKREREMEVGRAAEIHLPHQMSNYFSTIIFELCSSKRHLERSMLLDESPSHSLTHSHRHACIHTLIIYTFPPSVLLFLPSISCRLFLSVSMYFVLSLQHPPSLCLTVSLSVSQGSSSTDESPSYNITHWFKNCHGHWSETAMLLGAKKVISAC